MKLTGNIGVNNKALAVLNIAQKRPSWSCLSLGRYPSTKELFLLLQTRGNLTGTKYKVTKNISKIITSGSKNKATLSFIEPHHDIYINADESSLIRFLKVLRNHLNGVGQELELTNLATLPAKIPSKEKIKLVVKSKAGLPGDDGYGRKLEIIEINDCDMKYFDRRILRLQHLRVLNLKGNSLESMPEQIDLLPNLREINLANNNFNQCRNWKWLTGPGIRNNLKELNLRENMLEYFPIEICKLNNLETLDLTKNCLTIVPNNIGWLRRLKNFLAVDNKLKCLPANISLLKLDRIDVSFVEFQEYTSPSETTPRDLVDLAGVACLHAYKEHDIKLTTDMLPDSLINYIESAGLCFCKEYVLPPKYNYIRSIPKFINVRNLLAGDIFLQQISIGFCYKHAWCHFLAC